MNIIIQNNDNQINNKNCDLSIIIINWNAAGVISNCLESINNADENISYETLLVDNASTDNSIDLIRSQYPWVHLITNCKNIGFARANNLAIERARGRYLLLLNPDTEIYPHTLTKLLNYADNHLKIGCIGPKILNPDYSVQRSCWRGFPDLKMALSDAFYLWKFPNLPFIKEIEFSNEQLNNIIDVDHLLGACILIRRKTWDEVGEFDKKFFIFFEETDWCYRAKLCNWRIIYYPDSIIIHLGEHSVHQKPEINIPIYYQSYIKFYKKHHSDKWSYIFCLEIIIALAAIIRIFLWQFRSVKDGRINKNSHAMQRGYLKVLRNVFSKSFEE